MSGFLCTAGLCTLSQIMCPRKYCVVMWWILITSSSLWLFKLDSVPIIGLNHCIFQACTKYLYSIWWKSIPNKSAVVPCIIVQQVWGFFEGWSYDYKWLCNAPLWYKSTTTASVKNSGWKQLISFLLWRILELTLLSEGNMPHSACAIVLSLIIRSSQRIPKVFAVWKTAVSIISTWFAYESTCKLSIHHCSFTWK
jgi:hypothetical protein